jgi:RNA recognition motif-containing protein
MCLPCVSRYVGNLDTSVSEDLVCALFSQIGPVKGCKIIREVRVSYVFYVRLCSDHDS